METVALWACSLGHLPRLTNSTLSVSHLSTRPLPFHDDDDEGGGEDVDGDGGVEGNNDELIC